VTVSTDASFDVVIVGAGPGGLSAAQNAEKNKLRYVLLEKTDHLADTIHCYQKGKFVMAEPTVIPLRGGFWMEPATREEILDRWAGIARTEGLNITLNSPVTEIIKRNGLFQIKAGAETLHTPKVVLAIGTQGSPRKLGVPGENLPHVLPRLIDPDMYSDQDIVVIGGGDSAIEIAVSLAARNRVTMSVRSAEFLRAKASLERQAVDKAKRGEMTIHFRSVPERVDPDSITLKLPNGVVRAKAQVVIVKIGAVLPRKFLESCGITFRSTEAEAPPALGHHYETEVPGLFLIGAANGRGDLIKHSINQGYEVIEHVCGRQVEPADEELLKQTLNFGSGTVAERIKAILPRAPILTGGSEEQIRELLLSSRFHRLQAGEIIFRQYDYSESLYVILDGSVKVLVLSDDGLERQVALKNPGESFGEMSMISGQRRSATAIASTEALLWEIDRKAMLKFVHMTPTAKDKIDKSFLIYAFQSYLFPGLSQSVLSPLADRAKVLGIDKGATIIKEGDAGDAFYFLRSGMVKVGKMRQEREVVLAYLAAGQYFGEMALLRAEPRMASVTAIDSVEVIQLRKEDFVDFLYEHPQLKARIDEESKHRRLRNIEVELRPELADLGRFMTSEEVVVSDNVLLIDENKCVHCDNCVKACEGVHTDGQTRLKRTGQKFANILIANSCRHCENPMCMTDCPPGDAIARDPRGEVYIRDNCIACGNCAANCPYDNIFMVHAKEQWSLLDWVKQAVGIQVPTATHSRSLPVKCDLCRELSGGPACVRSCPTGAVLRLTPEDYNRTIESLVTERKGGA
jgi:CRP-like cAMP-binding protein/thioredoxin reductase/Fe-S-cluster-containing dehydrogenase component